jgi:hypothetical protein
LGFKHPTPDDFFRTMENVAGEDLVGSGEVGFNTIGVLTKVNAIKYVKMIQTS